MIDSRNGAGKKKTTINFKQLREPENKRHVVELIPVCSHTHNVGILESHKSQMKELSMARSWKKLSKKSLR